MIGIRDNSHADACYQIKKSNVLSKQHRADAHLTKIFICENISCSSYA